MATGSMTKRILFLGLGSIGSRHVRLIKEIYGYDIYALRSKGKVKNKLGVKEIYSWREIDRVKPSIAFITNPTFLHVPTAIECAQRGMALFIEKPLSHDLRSLQKLLQIVRDNRVPTYVAYVLRFHPVIAYLKQLAAKNSFLHMRALVSSYLPSWRLGKDYLKNYSAHKKMGGGVINDLSHELDYVRYILGPIKNIKGQFSKRSSLTVDAEDYADILVETKSGPANIHMNFLSQKEQRTVQMDFKEKTVIADLIASTVKEYRRDKLVKQLSFPKDINDCYKAQLKYFFKNLNNTKMMNNVFEAKEVLENIVLLKQK